MGKNNKKINLAEMSLEEILDITDLIMRENDIVYFCNNIDVMKQFIKEFSGKPQKGKEARKFLIENQQYIDKEKFLLILIQNYKDNLEEINSELKKLKKLFVNGNNSGLERIGKLRIQSEAQQERLKDSLKLAKGIKAIIPVYYYDEGEKRYRLEIIDSREVIDGKKVSNSKNVNRFNEIDSLFKNENNELGLEFVLQSILLTDLVHVFESPQLGDDLRTMILENEVLRKKLKTRTQLDIIRSDSEEYRNLIEDVDYKELLPYVKQTLREYAQYIDLDKLLLISSYRFYRILEDKTLSSEGQLEAKELLRGIVYCIKKSDTEISGKFQRKVNDTYVEDEVTWRKRDVEEVMSHFTSNRYISSEEIQQYRDMLEKREVNLLEIDSEIVDIVFSEEELENIALLSEDNLLYVSIKKEWDRTQIIEAIKKRNSCSIELLKNLIEKEKITIQDMIELYELDIISLQDIIQINENIDLSKHIDFLTLDSCYRKLKESPEDEEAINKYEKYLLLYKEIYIKGKDKEQTAELSNTTIEKIVEMYEGEAYNEVAKKYYQDAIITLEDLVKWSEKELITSMYEEGIITLDDIKSVGNILGFDYIRDKYIQLVYDTQLDYDKRIDYIASGFVEEDTIIDLYNLGFIMDDDLIELSKKHIILEETAKEVIEDRNLEDRIKNARAVATQWLENKVFDITGLRKKQNDERETTKLTTPSNTDKLMIDPNVRQEYLELLGLYRINVECDEDCAFYDYEFYATPDEYGNIGPNSVIIAERYFEDKDTQSRFATNNATYFFKYKDFLVLSNLTKPDMMKERENSVFRANHGIKRENRKGNWAQSVLYCVLKTMLGSDLKGLSEKEKRQKLIELMKNIYLKEERGRIFELCEEIDKTDNHIYILDKNRTRGTKKKNKFQDTENPLKIGPLNLRDNSDGER